MRRIAFLLVLGAAGLSTAGCLDIEQSLTLERNLSGTARFNMKVDMEPMVYVMVRMQREMSGQTGEPTAAELAKARAEFLASGKTKKTVDFESGKQELAAKLPKGVTLLDATFAEKDLSVAAGFVFGFDHVSKLEAIKFPKGKDAPAEPGGGPGNPIDTPFEGLKVVDEGATLLVTGPPQNPVADSKEQMPPDPEMQKMVTDMLKGLRVAFTITAPFEVVQHNAHRKEGNTLIWQYDLKTLQTLTPQQLNESIKVRYRK
jgi:hypothetical protein